MIVFIYQILTTALIPVFFLSLIYRKLRGKIKDRLFERIGISIRKPTNQDNYIMIHAVSVGESRAAFSLIAQILKKTQYKILITTTTTTSFHVINQQFSNEKRVLHHYLPIDEFNIMSYFLKKWKVKKIVILESEIWPNLITIANKMHIEVCIVNGIISDSSYEKWRFINKIGGFEIFKCIGKINTEIDNYEKFKALSPNSKIIYTENIKYDTSLIKMLDFKKKSINNKHIITLGSVHEIEYSILRDPLLELIKMGFLIVFVPRHPNKENIGKISNLFSETKIDKDVILKDSEFVLVTKIGVLIDYYNQSDLAIICGSFAESLNGHNPLEALHCGIPVLCGENYNDFKKVYQNIRADFFKNFNLDIITNATKLPSAVEIIMQINQTKIRTYCSDLIERHRNIAENIFDFIFDENKE